MGSHGRVTFAPSDQWVALEPRGSDIKWPVYRACRHCYHTLLIDSSSHAKLIFQTTHRDPMKPPFIPTPPWLRSLTPPSLIDSTRFGQPDFEPGSGLPVYAYSQWESAT